MLRWLRLDHRQRPGTRALATYGGEHTSLQRLLMKGIGSPRVLVREVELFPGTGGERLLPGEPATVSFELLREGLLLHLRIGGRLRSYGLRLADLPSIHLMAYPKRVRMGRRLTGIWWKIVHRGVLTLTLANGAELVFGVPTVDFPGVRAFFDKFVFTGKYRYEVGAEEARDGFTLWWLEWLE